MFAGVPSTTPSASSRSEAVAASAARRRTSTPVISGSLAPRTTASSSSWVAGEGVWWTISRTATPPVLPDERGDLLPEGRHPLVGAGPGGSQVVGGWLDDLQVRLQLRLGGRGAHNHPRALTPEPQDVRGRPVRRPALGRRAGQAGHHGVASL